MIVEEGVPEHNPRRNTHALADGNTASAGVGEDAKKRGAGLPDGEACSDETTKMIYYGDGSLRLVMC